MRYLPGRQIATALAAALSALALGCSDGPAAPEDDPPFGLIISDPVVPAGAAASAAVAFVSVAPGSFPGGTNAAVQNRRTRLVLPVLLQDGGLDPVGVIARAGDTLDLTVTLPAGRTTSAFAVVPAHRAPQVVRTVPSDGGTNVVPGAKVALWFSEPVDPATITGETVRLMVNGAVVPGVARLVAGSLVSVEFVPATPLDPATAYQLVLTAGVADLNGEALRGRIAASFTTQPPVAVPARWWLAIPSTPGFVTAQQVFSDPVHVFATRTDGTIDQTFSGVVTVALSANAPGAVLGGTTSATAVNGVATFPDLAVSLAGAGFTLTASSPGAVSGSSGLFDVAPPTPWKPVSPGRSRMGNALVAVNGFVYVIGGIDSDWEVDALIPETEMYNPASDGWTDRAPLPTPRSLLGAAAIGGIIYAVGGIDATNISAVVEAYDPATNVWTTKAPLPTARYGMKLGVVGGLLYAVGGYEGGIPTDRVDAYDPALNSWSPRAPMPSPHTWGGAGVVGGILYVAGGYGPVSDHVTNEMHAYDPVADKWTTRAPMPSTGQQFGVAVLNGLMYRIGGFVETAFPATEMLSYDPAADAWTAGPGIAGPVWATEATALSATLYAYQFRLYAYTP